ncbi:hypothetical protein V8D89_010537 [Ganoderma adspersum]
MFKDMVPSSWYALPSQFAPIIPLPPPIPQPSPAHPPPSSVSSEEEQDEFDSTPNAFGIFRHYFCKPQQVPEDDGILEAVCDAPGLEGSNATNAASYQSIFWLSHNVAVSVDTKNPDYGPFANVSQFRLFNYFYDHSEVQSHDTFDDLLHVLHSEGFSVEDLKGFSAKKGKRTLEEWVGWPGSIFLEDDGWRQSSITIPLPPPKRNPNASETTAATFKAAVQDTGSHFADRHHWVPHEMYWICAPTRLAHPCVHGLLQY